MRTLGVLLAIGLALLLRSPATGTVQQAPLQVLITEVAHTLDGRTLIVTGLVRNLGAQALPRLVVDVSGFGPSGELVTAGSDGIPWTILPGASDRFSIAMPVPRRLIREYVVQVAKTTPPFNAIVSLRRGVELALYRPLFLSLIQLRTQIHGGLLTLQADTDDLPITHVSAAVTILLLSVVIDEEFEVVTLRFDLPANSSTSVFLGTPRALLLTSRVVDFRLRATWTD
ncbi:MAG: hypothetical protein HYU65_05360 [Armatimonadetes bacterium]|nr:hypothetical protein [Armatimonadota bacterium]